MVYLLCFGVFFHSSCQAFKHDVLRTSDRIGPGNIECSSAVLPFLVHQLGRCRGCCSGFKCTLHHNILGTLENPADELSRGIFPSEQSSLYAFPPQTPYHLKSLYKLENLSSCGLVGCEMSFSPNYAARPSIIHASLEFKSLSNSPIRIVYRFFQMDNQISDAISTISKDLASLRSGCYYQSRFYSTKGC